MNHSLTPSSKTLFRDLVSGTIVFLVALPLCLGIALASGAPLFSGIVAGIVGGIVVGILSGSHTSVSGPAAGLTAIVAAQISQLGSFQAFLLAVFIAGVFQIVLGIIRAGSLSAFFPSSVIKGLLGAIGTILIIKQIPYLLGYDMVPHGPVRGHANIITQIGKIFTGQIHWGAFTIGLFSMVLLLTWERIPRLKKLVIPAPLIVVVMGVLLGSVFARFGSVWALDNRMRFLVNVPEAHGMKEFLQFLSMPDFSQWANPAIYVASVTLAIVASLETLLNLDAVDKLDKKQRLSPPSRELVAQGIGNIVCGLLGGLPVTSVVIRGSVNVSSGSETKLSAFFHGVLLLICVVCIPAWLNRIPLSCLAAILLTTGFKLASPKVIKSMWKEGPSQFWPFAITLLAIVATDLLIGIGIGLFASLLFILASNLTLPIRQIVEKHVGGEIRHIELANQVSFLNRAALESVLRDSLNNSHILLDARRTNYIDPDVLSLIREFKDLTAPAHNVRVSLRGFREKYGLTDDIQFVDYTTQELQSQLTPDRVLQILSDGNERFRLGHRLDRDLFASQDAGKEHPMAVILSGADPRTPVELIFDLGLGDVFNVRMAGNVIGQHVLGSLEYGCMVGGAKLVLVMGHTRSGVVRCAIEHFQSAAADGKWAACPNLTPLLVEIQRSIDVSQHAKQRGQSEKEMAQWIDETSRLHVMDCVNQIVESSSAIRQLVDMGKIRVLGAMFDVDTGRVDFLRANQTTSG